MSNEFLLGGDPDEFFDHKGCHYGSLMCRACFERATAHLTKEDVEQALRLTDGMNQEQFDAYTDALRKSPSTH